MKLANTKVSKDDLFADVMKLTNLFKSLFTNSSDKITMLFPVLFVYK